MGDVVRPTGNLGIVVGLPHEAAILARVLGRATPPVACAGARPAGAAEGAANLIERGAQVLVSFGLAGALDPSLSPGDIVVASAVIAPDGRRYECDAELRRRLRGAGDAERRRPRSGLLAGVDRVLASVDAKRALAAQTSAIAIDMESHALAAAAGERPFAVIRVVVDPAARAIPASVVAALRPDGRIDPIGLIAGLLRRPGELAALAALARDHAAARRGLRRAAAALGRALGLVQQ